MSKRYTFQEWTKEGRYFPQMVESPVGEFVRYDDITPSPVYSAEEVRELIEKAVARYHVAEVDLDGAESASKAFVAARPDLVPTLPAAASENCPGCSDPRFCTHKEAASEGAECKECGKTGASAVWGVCRKCFDNTSAKLACLEVVAKEQSDDLADLIGIGEGRNALGILSDAIRKDQNGHAGEMVLVIRRRIERIIAALDKGEPHA